MRASKYFFTTSKEVPSDAEIISHQLMLRAGLIRKLASGLYTWLPLGLRVLQKVTNIVREEMNQIGAQELLMPAIQPAALWVETNRWDQFGKELLKITDRHKREFCFGPTHEEVITDLIRRELHSYKQLPLCVYQIQNKFRDEIRPRFGVMRAREFLMKDAYSFHLERESLQKTYDDMYAAYSRICTRIGFTFRAVLADTGAIGGSGSHEFHVLADSGEDLIAYSDTSSYAANVELAPTLPVNFTDSNSKQQKQMIATPNCKTINDLEQKLNVKANQILKTLIVKGSESPFVAIVLRGDHELNSCKAEKVAAIAKPLTFATEQQIIDTFNCAPGSLGPIGLTIPVLADHAVLTLHDFICGANQADQHYQYVNWQRDCPLPQTLDLRSIQAGDPSPDGQGQIKLARGIEVGHIFQLGTKYSASMQAVVTAENGAQVPLEMGCYGIGVSRMVAAAIEQHHDSNGIIWPINIAPFQIALVALNYHTSKRVNFAADALYQKLTDAGFEVIFDDRDMRAGVLFADMDLIGIPHRLVISERCLDNEVLEYKARDQKEAKQIKHADLMTFLAETIKKS